VAFRVNLALYAAYAGDYQTAEKEAASINPPEVYGTLALAFAQLGQGRYPEARATYEQMATLSALGASFSSSGLGDLAAFHGRFGEALTNLRQGLNKDLAEKRSEAAAGKLMAISYAELSRGNTRAAIAAAKEALSQSRSAKIRFLAGLTYIEGDEVAAARPLIADLGLELTAESPAYAKILEGAADLAENNVRQAIKVLDEANKLLDTWIGHFYLGRAYLAAEGFTQADSEFDRCLTRKGEVFAMFLDEEPTYAYLPQVYYYQGLTREGMKTEKFGDSYRAYLAIRDQSKEDPLVAKVRQRLAAGGR
jgi:tetratricopeptide (TPR) repeat protein